MSELRTWFLRNVLEAAERQLGVPALARLRSKLPPRLSRHASLEVLRASAAFDAVPLEEGEELLLSLDSVLGDGSGKVLQDVGFDLAMRVLSQGDRVARPGDLAATVARLGAFLEHPFLGVPFSFALSRNSTGFTLSVGVQGHSRATRAVRHLTIGAIIAAERFAREVGSERLQISADTVADRSHIRASYLPVASAVTESQPPRSRKPPATRNAASSLSAEVERILRSSSPPQAPSNPLQLAVSANETSRVGSERSARSERPGPSARERARQESAESQPPESTTLRVGNVAALRGPAVK